MTIGLPRAYLYYRYSSLWTNFFLNLGIRVVTSGETNREMLEYGIRHTIDEGCLPLKLYMGHIHSLSGKCDAILIPRFERTDKNEEFCVRFFGLYDIVRNTYPNLHLIQYNLHSGSPYHELNEFVQMGRSLGKSGTDSVRAYLDAKKAQTALEKKQYQQQKNQLAGNGLKILLASQPYISHDRFLGQQISHMIRSQGGVPIFSDHCDKKLARKKSKKLTTSLYWTMNKETVGTISLYRERVDGIILLSAFPCGTDSLVNDLILRRIKGVPAIQILLDEQQAEAGLQTRIESFMDILKQRKTTI